MVKKIAHERLSALVFKEECIVTACQVPPLLRSQLQTQLVKFYNHLGVFQDGYVCTWARPGRSTADSASQHKYFSPHEEPGGGAGAAHLSNGGSSQSASPPCSSQVNSTTTISTS